MKTALSAVFLSCLVCAVDGREGERDRPGRDALARHIGGDQLDRLGGFLAVVQTEHDCGVRFGKALRRLSTGCALLTSQRFSASLKPSVSMR